MYKLGIIGIGTIGATYHASLEQLGDLFRVTAVCDIDAARSHPALYPNAAFYTDHQQMLRTGDVDCVMISTPIHTHVPIARTCLEAGKHVLLEKPAALHLEDIASLFALANKNNVVFHVGFHASFALDLEWYLAHQKTLEPSCRLERIENIRCLFCDPYMQNGIVDPGKEHLGGSYIDSAVNALSVCARLVPIRTYGITVHDTHRTDRNAVYASNTQYEGAAGKITVETAWNKGLNHKSTLLQFSGTGQQILLDHTGQRVVHICPGGQSRVLYSETDRQRLPNQYIGVFRDFAQAILNGGDGSHAQQVLHIHRLLLPEDPFPC